MTSNIIDGPSVDDATIATMRCLTAGELDSVSGGGAVPVIPGQKLPCPCGCGGKC